MMESANCNILSRKAVLFSRYIVFLEVLLIGFFCFVCLRRMFVAEA